MSSSSAPNTIAPDRIAAIGEQALLAGFQLAGVTLHACENEAETLHAWSALPVETALVILTPRSARALGPALSDSRSPMTLVLPS
ncbi:hypothetical protein CVS29_09790 [Arthrobacter psychrochitiniphilus]|uniref:Uncharacterized protein n=1 Tax=Arthrobacter psychrochitiniphilus TaxID=291045 RepID=A0A2V3DRW7_9MICC|nr:hypothetical protein CVS29_09790 [Arthrobacter psychrochitiniphilus]